MGAIAFIPQNARTVRSRRPNMFASLALFAGLLSSHIGPQQPHVPDRRTLIEQIVGQPTGQNGYEEYLRAAEMLKNSQLWIYEQRTYGQTLPEDLSPADRDLVAHLKNKAYIDIKHEEVERFKGAIELVREGNQKPVADPRGLIKPETLLPEFSYFRNLARLFAWESYLKFSDGDGHGGTKSLLDGMRFSYKLANGTLIAALVGIACNGIELGAFEDRLSSLSIDDCHQIQETVAEILSGPNPLAGAFEKERQSALYVGDLVFKKGGLSQDQMNTMDFGPENKGAMESLKAASPAELQQWGNSYKQSMNQFFAALQSRLRQPEHAWSGSRTTKS